METKQDYKDDEFNFQNLMKDFQDSEVQKQIMNIHDEQDDERCINSGVFSLLPTEVIFAIGISTVGLFTAGLFTGYTTGMLYRIGKKVDQIDSNINKIISAC